MRTVALIPARAGSERIKDKNIRILAGHPLLAHSIQQARLSGVFDDVILCTDSANYADIARRYGARSDHLRPSDISQSSSPDIAWVTWAIERYSLLKSDRIVILRPTSPFRQITSILECLDMFQGGGFHSVRAVSPVSEHPGKMWTFGTFRHISPLLPFHLGGTPFHSNQTKVLPEVFVQNASLEVTVVDVILNYNSIAGEVVGGFRSPWQDSVDVNTEMDFLFAEFLVRDGHVLSVFSDHAA